MIKIPTPTPIEIEAVLVDMMGGTNAFGRWVKLGDFHLPFGGEATRVGDTMWWADVIGPDNCSMTVAAVAPRQKKLRQRHGSKCASAPGGAIAQIRARRRISTLSFAI